MSRRNFFAITFAALLILATPGRAQQLTLFAATGSTGSAGELYILNPLDGSTLFDVGPLLDFGQNNYGMSGLRYDPDDDAFYGATTPSSPTDPSYLLKVNPITARVRPIGSFQTHITDIAFDPVTRNMYGVSGSEAYLFTIDLTTGLATAVGPTGIYTELGGGLAANSSGTLYGVDAYTLYTYDKTTGAATEVGPLGIHQFVRALAFDANDTLYGIAGGAYNADTATRSLVTIDPTTGLATIVGPSVNNLDALAFLPSGLLK